MKDKYPLHPPRRFWLPPIKRLHITYRSWPLSVSALGVFFFCNACSFNNSFKEGCIGSIRIQVPNKKKQGQHAKTQPRKIPPPGESMQANILPDDTTQGDPQPIDAQPAVKFAGDIDEPGAKAASSTTLEGRTPRRSAQATLSPSRRRLQQDARRSAMNMMMFGLLPDPPPQPTKRAAPTRPSLLQEGSEPPRRPTSPEDARLRQLLEAEARMHEQGIHIHMLHSRVPQIIWKERPTEIQLCYDSRHRNAGWNHAHPVHHTAQLNKRCQSGHALGRGQHWFVLSDTFAASALTCRLFFSPGRLAVVAQCGGTLYRASIRPFASCLQQGKGCEIPRMVLKRMPRYSKQAVERYTRKPTQTRAQLPRPLLRSPHPPR